MLLLQVLNDRLPSLGFIYVAINLIIKDESKLRQKLGVIIGVLDGQTGASIVQKIVQSIVSIRRYLNFVFFGPNDNADQDHEYVQRGIQLQFQNGT